MVYGFFVYGFVEVGEVVFVEVGEFWYVVVGDVVCVMGDIVVE